jgi:hypothetical protein
MSFSLLITSRMSKLRSGSDTRPSSCSGMLITISLSSVADFPSNRAFMPPGWKREWHIGVRVSSNKKLVAFISGVPIHLRVRKK